MSRLNQQFGFIAIIALLIGSLVSLSAGLSYTSASELNSPLQTSIAGTAVSVRTRVAQTLDAIQTKAASTLNAVKTKVPATIAAVQTKVISTIEEGQTKIAGTLNAYRTSIPATLTAYAPTINAYRTQFAQTATAFGPTAQAFRTNIPGTATAFAATFARTPIAAQDASAALVSYGASTLGITIASLTAAGASGIVVGTFPLPQEILNSQSVSANLATQTYYGTVANGLVWLSLGTGSLTGNTGTTVDVQNASLGIYSLTVPGSVTSADAALALAKATYPNLFNLTYIPETVNAGYGFYARSVTTVIVNGIATASPETVVLYILPGANGKAAVTAAVGSGEYSTMLHP